MWEDEVYRYVITLGLRGYISLIIIMSKRELVPILRQSLLICRDPLQRFLLLHAPSNTYSLPIFHSVIGEGFRQGLERGMSEFSIEAKIKGIIRMEAGRSTEGRFYRCIYYATESSMISSKVVFRSYEELSSI